MRVKKVNRYYCEFCKKSGCNAYWIKKHEERCTMNPNRYCGYCNLLDKPQSNLQELITILPDPINHKCWDEYTGEFNHYDSCLSTELDEAMPKLRDAAENCPACIMAALRQKGIPVPLATDFNFSKECEEIWDCHNAQKLEEEQMRESYYY